MAELTSAAAWRRGMAALLDGALGALLWVWSSMCLVAGVWGVRSAPLELEDAAVLAAALVLLAVVLHFVYHVGFVGGCGQTPGRMALGIAVVRRDGRPVGAWRALVRSIGGAFSLLTLGIAAVGMFFTRERRGFADWLAGTRVVRVVQVPRTGGERFAAVALPPPSQSSGGPDPWRGDPAESRTGAARARISENASL